jgi:hypothetical protein
MLGGIGRVWAGVGVEAAAAVEPAVRFLRISLV